MADAGVNVLRLDGVTSNKVNAVKVLRQLEKIGAHLTRAGHLAAQRHVPVVGRGRDIAKQDMLVAHGDLPFRVARRQRPRRRCLAHHLHDKVTAHTHVVTIDSTARFLQDATRLVVEELNTDLFEDAHRPVMDRLHPFLGQRFGRTVHIDRLTPWHLLDNTRTSAPRCIACAATTSPSASGLICHDTLP